MSALPSWDDALQRVLDATEPLACETVDTPACSGRVLAVPVHAPWDLPQRSVSMMDGYAVRAEDLEVESPVLVVAGESAAGRPASESLARGHAVRISTGAVLPEGADIVVPQEDTERDGATLRVDRQRFGEVRPGRWLRRRGSDFAEGEMVLAAGQYLGPGDIALAAATGHETLAVHRRPVVAIVSTGDELVPLGTRPAPGEIVSSNGFMLAAQVEAAGGIAVDHGIAPDDPSALRRVLADALRADVVVTSGGISVGEHDLVERTFVELGCAFAFHGVALRPGKPTAFGRAGGTLVFGLPGNPASSLTTFALFVRPALRRLLGVRGDVRPATVEVGLRNAAGGAGRRAHFVRARLHTDGTATILASQVSGDLRSIRDFDAFVEVPAGVASIPAGGRARALLFDPWWMERRSS
jgi:molybdopterin molybdotransferase